MPSGDLKLAVSVKLNKPTTCVRELLYSSQAPSVSLQHDLDANSFEPFHSMGETISSRLRQLLVKQMETHEEDDVDMDEEAKTKLGKSRSTLSASRHTSVTLTTE